MSSISLSTFGWVTATIASISGLIIFANKVQHDAIEKYRVTKDARYKGAQVMGFDKQAYKYLVDKGFPNELKPMQEFSKNIQAMTKTGQWAIFSFDGKKYIADKEDILLSIGQIKKDYSPESLESQYEP